MDMSSRQLQRQVFNLVALSRRNGRSLQTRWTATNGGKMPSARLRRRRTYVRPMALLLFSVDSEMKLMQAATLEAKAKRFKREE